MISAPDMTPTPAAWTSFRRRLLGYVRRRVDEPADAEDIVQDVLARAAIRLPTLRSSSALLPWLFSSTRNAIADYYRAGIRDQGSGVGETEPDLPVAGEDVNQARETLLRCVEPMLDALPERYRDAVRRVDLQGERQVDLARELGIGISALKSRVQRGRAMLLQAFTDCCNLERDARGTVVELVSKRRKPCRGAEPETC
ncbi:MAG: sigma-70 family RNA polymerase sigma factor [Gemmatimonadales bacterium]